MKVAQEKASDFLPSLQKNVFKYFSDLVNPENGLIPDTSLPGSPASIAGVGFALSSYPIGVERGYLSREAATQLTLTTLRFFNESTQGKQSDVSGYRGFYYHFLDMKTGKRIWDCELSFIDTGFLLAGILCVAQYFDQKNKSENEIRSLAEKIFDRVDWTWAMGGKTSMSLGWRPDSGFINYGWEGYSEALLLYTLALGSATAPLPIESFEAWTSTYQWENIYDFDFLYAGPFFIHLFSHAWIDFRGIKDQFMTEKKTDYFENTRNALKVQKSYCIRNPKGFDGYGQNCWGISASEGPGNQIQMLRGDEITFSGYAARGIPYGPDDGTIAPSSAIAALAFDRDTALESIEHLRQTYPQILGSYGFTSSFNASIRPAWFSDKFYALDIGIESLFLENSQTGLIWNLMKKSPIIRRGLTRAGFQGSWLEGYNK